MARRRATGRRSRIIRLLRIGLPLVAVGLLLAVFLTREPPITDASLTFSEADLEAMRSGAQVLAPQLSGASEGGDIYDFKATTVTPRNLDFDQADISDLVGTIYYVDGPTVFVASHSAQVDLQARQMVLETGIILRTSNGYKGNADRIEIDAVTAVIVAEGNVQADGPIGRISADRLTISPPEGAQEPKLGKEAVLHFQERVKVYFDPKALDEPGSTDP